MPETNEIGSTPPRRRPSIAKSDAEDHLSDAVGEEVRLPDSAVVSGSPASCPACGSERVMWGCDDRQTRTKDEIHPLVWDADDWMAESFICEACDAGWIEREDAPISWVRPYWSVSAS